VITTDIRVSDFHLSGKRRHAAGEVNGVDVFDPSGDEVRSDTGDGIARWSIDTSYNKESFFSDTLTFSAKGSL
jgi:hypothetical protein